jgi:hypothetical protein
LVRASHINLEIKRLTLAMSIMEQEAWGFSRGEIWGQDMRAKLGTILRACTCTFTSKIKAQRRADPQNLDHLTLIERSIFDFFIVRRRFNPTINASIPNNLLFPEPPVRTMRGPRRHAYSASPTVPRLHKQASLPAPARPTQTSTYAIFLCQDGSKTLYLPPP